MKRTLITTYLILGSVFTLDVTNDTTPIAGDGSEHDADDDEEGDSAPFTVVLQHADGWRCGGSLISLRTALTSAQCARGRGPAAARDLVARAPQDARALRRVARVALALDEGSPRDAEWAPEGGQRDGWAAAAADLAVLELEEPFGGAAQARAILMATQASECAPRMACHVVRAQGHAPRLRIADVTLVPGEACAQRARGWPAVRDDALCLVGPTLCDSEWGAGVVCAGKLCGVLSRSAGAPHDAPCGDTHVALSVPRWRRFLHCAHTLRACGSGGECAQLCTERRLLEPELEARGASAAPAELRMVTPAALSTRPAAPRRTLKYITDSAAVVTSATRSLGPTRSSPAPATNTQPPAPETPARSSHEYEPNRPDFKGGGRTSRVSLKAGEYGDNAAEYGGDEGPALEAAVSPPQANVSQATPVSQPEARHQPVAATPVTRANTALAARATWACVLLCTMNILVSI